MGLTKEEWDEVSHEHLIYLQESWAKYRASVNSTRRWMTQDEYILFWSRWLSTIEKLQKSGYDLSRIKFKMKPQNLPGVL